MEQKATFSLNSRFETPKFFEYLLVVHPNAETFNQLKEEKENFSSKYDADIARKTLPHITIANFLAKETMEETLIKWMHKIISSQKSFDVMINNFSGFPSSKTVYARIQNHEPFKQLATSLKTINTYINDNGFPNAKLINHPHMTIARSLQQNVYEKAIMDYSHKIFNASFKVDELILLRRVNQYDKCKQVSVFKLSDAGLNWCLNRDLGRLKWLTRLFVVNLWNVKREYKDLEIKQRHSEKWREEIYEMKR